MASSSRAQRSVSAVVAWTRTIAGPPGTRVFVATGRVDGRKGIDGLSVLARSGFAEDPLSGTLHVFFSRRADRVRVSYWDRDGYVLVTKRSRRASFACRGTQRRRKS